MWDESVQGRKIKCPSDLKMTVNLWNSKYPHIINSSMAGFYTTIFILIFNIYDCKCFG